MIVLKNQAAYKEGTLWNDNTHYNSAKPYNWKGGPINGTIINVMGCAAFSFILSDEAFGSLPARTPAYSFENVKVGDILRMSNNTHTVIVLEVNDAGVVIAGGNNGGKVHRGRAISKAELDRDVSTYITRYPEGYVAPDDPTTNEELGSGILDGGLAWKLTKAGTLTISGSGAMQNFPAPRDSRGPTIRMLSEAL